MQLLSNTIKDNDILPQSQTYNGFGCTGENVSPDLRWNNYPADTKSFAITVYDPDAPVNGGWWHWLAVNIPISKNELQTGEKMQAPVIETLTSFGSTGFGGACPPVGHGFHRYIFTVYALNTDKLINVSEKTQATFVMQEIENHTLDKASITAKYQR